MSKFYLGIDGGASSAKWCLVDDSRRKIKEGKSGPIDGHIYRAESKARFTEFIAGLAKEISEEVAAIYLGLTGAPESIEKQSALLYEIRAHFPVAKSLIENDVFLAYRSAFGSEQGILLYAGTGSILIFSDKDNQLKRIGGWGYLLGDEGAGYWIGRESIRKVLFDLEVGEVTELSEVVFRSAQGRDWDSIKRFVYSADRSEIAALAKEVIELSESGVESAQEIIDAAGAELAALVERGFLAVGDSKPPVIFAGGISRGSSRIKAAIEQELGVEISIFHGDTSLTAAELARSL